MTKFKRLASIAMVGCIMGSMLEMNANAVNVALTENNEASSTSIITISEYEKALQEAGKPYGIEVEVLDYNPNIKLTQEMLNNAVRELQEAGSTITITDLTPASNPATTPIRAMLIRDTYETNFKVSSLYGYAYITVWADVTCDFQNSNVAQVHSIRVYQQGGYVNFNSWETLDTSYQRNYPSNGNLDVGVTGLARFEHPDSITGATVGITIKIDGKHVTIKCC